MKYILFTLLSFLATATIQAQQEYTWDDYNLGFTLADDFKETKNTDEEFSADGDGMSMSIIPFENDAIDETDITAYTVSIFSELGVNRTDDVSLIELNGFHGGYAEGSKDGERIFIMGLIDPGSATNFFVIITFGDDDQNAVDEAVNICQSIHKL